MNSDRDAILFGGELRALKELTVDEVIWRLFDGEDALLDVCMSAPELAWSAILEAMRREPTAEQTALLAAGPLENLLALHGVAFIDPDRAGGAAECPFPLSAWRRVEEPDATGRLGAGAKGAQGSLVKWQPRGLRCGGFPANRCLSPHRSFSHDPTGHHRTHLAAPDCQGSGGSVSDAGRHHRRRVLRPDRARDCPRLHGWALHLRGLRQRGWTTSFAA